MCEEVRPEENSLRQCPRCGCYTQGRFCGQCGATVEAAAATPLNNAALVMPESQRKIPVWVQVLVAAAAFLVVAAFVFACVLLALRFRRNAVRPLPGNSSVPSVSQPAQSGQLPNGVSPDEYRQLSNGMTYAQASAIIGGDGTIVHSGENLQGDPYYVYGFPGEYNVRAAVYLTITNDVITDISVEGSLE